MLATTQYGETGSGRAPLLIAHGLFGSGRNFGVIARNLADSRPVITVDMRNHGSSPWTETHTYPDLAADLAEVIETAGGRADVLGHSMGGKAAMALALSRPDLVDRLIVADIAPVAYGHSRHLGYLRAMRDLDLGGLTTRGEAERRLRATIPDLAVRAFLVQSLDLAERKWRLNLPVLERDMPAIMDFPAFGTSFEKPALFLSGGASDYVLTEHRYENPPPVPHRQDGQASRRASLAARREAARVRGGGQHLPRSDLTPGSGAGDLPGDDERGRDAQGKPERGGEDDAAQVVATRDQRDDDGGAG